MTSPVADRAGHALRLRLPPARSLLGVLLVAMAAGQLSDVAGFARILDTYQVFPGWLPTVAAWALITTESSAGVALLAGRRRGGDLALVVALAWTLLATQAFARGLALDNCGCFGVHLGQPLRWWVLIEDAEFLALALWVRRTGLRPGPPPVPHPDRVALPRAEVRPGPRAG